LYELVQLLNGLRWPTENRYVILYNEPNHANEWGGSLDPADYVDTFVTLARALKAANPDFFVLPAGLDASSADDEAAYLSQMIAARPEMLTLMDGWTSHSYPNPAFSGSPYARGRGTLSTFDWELGYLQSLGLTKKLPVFITETGWEHSEGKENIAGLLSSDQVGSNLISAAGSVWTDARIAAITPFIYNYQDVPFDHFSWRRLGSDGFYPMYGSYRSIAKVKGTPRQHENYSLLSDLLPAKLIAGSSYALSAIMENTGQGIVSSDDGYTLTLATGAKSLDIFVDPLPLVEPGQQGQIMLHIKTPPAAGPLPLTLSLTHNDRQILLQSRTVMLVPPPSVTIHAQLAWRTHSNATNVAVLIYDKDTLLQKFARLTLKNGFVTAAHVVNIIPGLPYRVVILVPGYLPRQIIGALGSENTVLYPDRFLPLDFDYDGAFTVADIKALLQFSPWTAILRFFGP
jgi:hypothetical protein